MVRIKNRLDARAQARGFYSSFFRDRSQSPGVFDVRDRLMMMECHAQGFYTSHPAGTVKLFLAHARRVRKAIAVPI